MTTTTKILITLLALLVAIVSISISILFGPLTFIDFLFFNIFILISFLLYFYIISIGIFITFYFIYFTLVKFINIFKKYPILFKVTMGISILLLLLFCWLNYSFTAFFTIFLLLFTAIFSFYNIHYLSSYFIFFKKKYPNLYKISRILVWGLSVIILAICSKFLYSEIGAEVPSIGIQNKTNWNFVASCPLESNETDEIMKKLAEKEQEVVMKRFAEKHEEFNTLREVLDKALSKVDPTGRGRYELRQGSDGEWRMYLGIDPYLTPDQNNHLMKVEYDTRAKIKETANLLLDNTTELEHLDSRRAAYIGGREYTEEYFKNYREKLYKYKDGYQLYKLLGKNIVIKKLP